MAQKPMLREEVYAHAMRASQNLSTECALPTNASLFVILRESWLVPLLLMNYSALALFAQRTHIPTSARSIGFCVVWVCTY